MLEPQRAVRLVDEVDLVVVGGSCTGVFAAVRAARMGLRVAVIEQQNCFGGMATAATVNVWHRLYDTTGEQQIIAGLTQEILDRLHARDAVLMPTDSTGAFFLNTEELKIELDELVTKHGIHPYLHTFYAAPLLQGHAFDAVIVENRNGRQAIRARQFIDATGDGTLARHVGSEFRNADFLQPPTTCAKLQGLATLGDFDWQKAVRDHGPEFGLENDWGWGGPIPGLTDIQFRADSHVFDCDASDADELSHAEIEGRRKVRAIQDIIRKYGPTGSNVTLVDLAASIGVRETRRMIGAYTLTGDDVLNGVRFEDAVANGSYHVDIHHAKGPGITFRYLDGTETVIADRTARPQHGRWRDPLPEDPTFYQIPWRSLLQNNCPNLAVAGRMLDADKTAFSAARVMVNMNQTGEAAGTASALAVSKNLPIQEVGPVDIRQSLADGGSIVV